VGVGQDASTVNGAVTTSPSATRTSLGRLWHQGQSADLPAAVSPLSPLLVPSSVGRRNGCHALGHALILLAGSARPLLAKPGGDDFALAGALAEAVEWEVVSLFGCLRSRTVRGRGIARSCPLTGLSTRGPPVAGRCFRSLHFG